MTKTKLLLRKRKKHILRFVAIFSAVTITASAFVWGVKQARSGEGGDYIFAPSTFLSGEFVFPLPMKVNEKAVIPLFLKKGQVVKVSIEGNNFLVKSPRNEIMERGVQETGTTSFFGRFTAFKDGMYFLEVVPLEGFFSPKVSISISSPISSSSDDNPDAPISLISNKGEIAFKDTETSDAPCLKERGSFWSQSQASCVLGLETLPPGGSLIYEVRPNERRKTLGLLVYASRPNTGFSLFIECDRRSNQYSESGPLLLGIDQEKIGLCRFGAQNLTDDPLTIGLNFLLKNESIRENNGRH